MAALPEARRKDGTWCIAPFHGTVWVGFCMKNAFSGLAFCALVTTKLDIGLKIYCSFPAFGQSQKLVPSLMQPELFVSNTVRI
jgi:hypothetical protein